MTDIEAIQTLLNLYSDGCSRRDWQQVMGTFVEDGTWGIKDGVQFTGHAAMQAAMAGFLTSFDYFIQINSPAIITLDGDTATARTTIRECGKFTGRDEALEVMGYYTDALVRTPQGWKFTRKTFSGGGAHRFPLSPGPALG